MSYGGLEYISGSNKVGGYGGGGYGNFNNGGFDPMGSFDANGGGFMTEEKSGGKGSDKKISKDRNSLIPLTIRQLVTANREDDVYKVDGAELSTIKIMGMASNFEEHSTNFNFKVSDGTGTIECKQWIEKESRAHSKLSTFRDGTLVKVVGNIRDYDGKSHVLVFDVTTVIDWNELSYHLLDVMLTHCQQLEGPIPTGEPTSRSPAPTGNSAIRNGNVPPNSFQQQASGAVSQGHLKQQQGGGGKEVDNVSRQVYNVYVELNDANAAGLSIFDVLNIVNRRGVHINMGQLKTIVDALLEDGRLYTTVDEEHHKITGSDEI